MRFFHFFFVFSVLCEEERLSLSFSRLETFSQQNKEKTKEIHEEFRKMFVGPKPRTTLRRMKADKDGKYSQKLKR